MPKLSMIVPVYNVEDYLAKCLDSIIYPELGDYEIILVNDGSTDASGEICREYAAGHPALIRLIEQENSGLGAARNTGIDAAKGDFLAFIDSDDYLSPGALPEMLALLDESCDIVFFDLRSVTEEGKVLKEIPGCALEGEFTLESYPELLFEMPSAWNKLYRRSLFTEHNVRYPARVWYEDMYATMKLYTLAGKMVSVRKCWHNYVQRAGSITNNKNTRRNLEIIPAVEAMLDAFREAGLYDRYRPQLEYAAFYNQVLTTCTRVNLADPKSEVQELVYADYLKKFPDYLKNPYLAKMPAKHRLIHFLIRARLRLPLHALMTLNNIVRGK